MASNQAEKLGLAVGAYVRMLIHQKALEEKK